MEKQPTVYILASRRAGTVYTGVTSNLAQRIHQHRNGLIPGFTSRYGIYLLVWFEQHSDMASAITREKRIKKWDRDWKLNLIEASNPAWIDLAIGLGLTSSAETASMDSRLRGNDGELA